jgi:hypothetical protein
MFHQFLSSEDFSVNDFTSIETDSATERVVAVFDISNTIHIALVLGKRITAGLNRI